MHRNLVPDRTRPKTFLVIEFRHFLVMQIFNLSASVHRLGRLSPKFLPLTEIATDRRMDTRMDERADKACKRINQEKPRTRPKSASSLSLLPSPFKTSPIKNNHYYLLQRHYAWPTTDASTAIIVTINNDDAI